jgi:hypothetical protein
MPTSRLAPPHPTAAAPAAPATATPGAATPASAGPAHRGIEPLLLTTTQISTFLGTQLLTRATGFFFRREKDTFLVTSRHVLFDEPTGHLPDRVEIGVHLDAVNLGRMTTLSLPLYSHGTATWRQGSDSGGDIDVAVLAIEGRVLPAGAALQCFEPQHLLRTLDTVEVGSPLLLVGFPLGFHDTVHHLPVVRQAIVASSFGLRFQGEGYFLTDARAHRGSSGAPVVMRCADAGDALPWKLLGVHSSRMDMGTRDLAHDEFLGLNCAWYADVLMTLTNPVPARNGRGPRPRVSA